MFHQNSPTARERQRCLSTQTFHLDGLPTPSGVFFVCLGAPCACANVSPGPRSLSTHTHCKLRVSKITAGERERSGRSREYTERGWQWVEFFRAESEVYNVESRKRTNERSTARETRTRFVCNFVRVFFFLVIGETRSESVVVCVCLSFFFYLWLLFGVFL